MPTQFHKLYQKNNYSIDHIEGLRGLSALSVILCHMTIYASLYLEKSQYLRLLDLPFIKAVVCSDVFFDIFFIISGFLIGSLLMKEYKDSGKVDLYRFIVRRFARIYPLYLFVLVLAAPISMVNCHYIWTNILLVNNFLPMEDQYLNWCWTIAVEFQFYLIFSMIILLVSKKIIGKKICYALAIGFFLLPMLVLSLGMAQLHDKYISNNIFYATSEELRQFLSIGFDKLYLHTATLVYGIGAAYLLVYHKTRLTDFLERLPKGCVSVFSLMILAAMLFTFANHHIWFLKRSHDVWQTSNLWILLVRPCLLHPLLFALLLLTSVPKGIVITSITKFLGSAVWRPLARLSYGTYLIHPLILLMGYSIFFSINKTATIQTYFQLSFFLILLTYLLAIPLFLLIEKPATALVVRALYRSNQRDEPAVIIRAL